MKKRRIRFIINPKSGIRKKSRLPIAIESYFDPDLFDIEICYTERPGHAIELSKEAVSLQFDTVVAVGGDGSINEAGNPLVSTNTKLGIIPHGSGNGLANHLGIPKNTKKALEIIKSGNVIQIDSCKCNERYFFSNLGIGFDVNVARQFSAHKIRGFLSYAIAVLVQFYFKYRPITLSAKNGSNFEEKKVFLCTIFNSNQYGFNIGLTPDASLIDGKFNVSIVSPFSKLLLLPYGLGVLLKKLNWIKELQTFNAEKIHLMKSKSETLKFQMDGDCFESDQDLNIKIEPASLNILAPEKSKI